MKTCFISMPLGTRKRPYSEQHLDFDMVFNKLIAPAAQEADLTLLRWDNASGQFTQRDALRAIISSDVLLADVSTLNPNVMYELGVRHAVNRGPSIILSVTGEQLPFYIAYIPAFFYDAHNPESLRPQLTAALRSAAKRSDGSPIYEFFPDLRVHLPLELSSDERQKRRSLATSKGTAFSFTRSPGETAYRSAEKTKAAEAAVREMAEVEPTTFIDMLKAYRDAGDWDQVIEAGLTPPPSLVGDPHVKQLVASALAHRGKDGDEERALALMEELRTESGEDGETCGIMGRIFKDRYKRSHGKDENSLQRAVEYYRRGFELQPNDLYAGYNAVTLSSMLREQGARTRNVAELMPHVQQVLQQRRATGEKSYSLETAAIELAVIERNWNEAFECANRANALKPTDWQRAAIVESLERLGGGLEANEQNRLKEIISSLTTDDVQEEEEDPDA